MIVNRWKALKEYFRKKKETRFFKEHGVSSWRSYHLKYDPDFNNRAQTIRRMFHGYPYVAAITSAGSLARPANNVIKDGYTYLRDWLESDCKGKTRMSIQRTNPCKTTKLDGSVIQDWDLNEICGDDTVFVAFQEERDYLMFLLKWETS